MAGLPTQAKQLTPPEEEKMFQTMYHYKISTDTA